MQGVNQSVNTSRIEVRHAVDGPVKATVTLGDDGVAVVDPPGALDGIGFSLPPADARRLGIADYPDKRREIAPTEGEALMAAVMPTLGWCTYSHAVNVTGSRRDGA